MAPCNSGQPIERLRLRFKALMRRILSPLRSLPLAQGAMAFRANEGVSAGRLRSAVRAGFRWIALLKKQPEKYAYGREHHDAANGDGDVLSHWCLRSKRRVAVGLNRANAARIAARPKACTTTATQNTTLSTNAMMLPKVVENPPMAVHSDLSAEVYAKRERNNECSHRFLSNFRALKRRLSAVPRGSFRRRAICRVVRSLRK